MFDYVLCVGGRIVGIVEAKRLTVGQQNVLTQAERYARGLVGGPFDYRGPWVPFLYATNGEVIWHHDVRHPLERSRQLRGFHSPAALGAGGKAVRAGGCGRAAGGDSAEAG